MSKKILLQNLHHYNSHDKIKKYIHIKSKTSRGVTQLSTIIPPITDSQENPSHLQESLLLTTIKAHSPSSVIFPCTHDPVLRLPGEHPVGTAHVVVLADPAAHVEPVHGPGRVGAALAVKQDQLLLGADGQALDLLLYLKVKLES